MISLHQDPDFDLAYGVFVIEFYARWCGLVECYQYLRTEKEMFSGVLPISIFTIEEFGIQGVPIIVITNDGVE